MLAGVPDTCDEKRKREIEEIYLMKLSRYKSFLKSFSMRTHPTRNKRAVAYSIE
jgi:hypothetical protein